jgi:hypothetical protein
MRDFFIALGVGLTLGLGLCVSSMTDPAKVQNFLDITGQWDPSLALVLASAVLVAFVGFRLTRLRQKPFFAEKFQFPHRTDIDLPLLIGPSLFGIGWGLVGLCPGPGLQVILTAPHSAVWFVPAMLAGLWIGRPAHRHARKRAANRANAV